MLLIVRQERLTDNPPRIVLARIQLSPVDVLELGPQPFLELLLGIRRQAPDLADQVGEFCGVLGQPGGTYNEHGYDQQDE
jgi:hypothetical protein